MPSWWVMLGRYDKQWDKDVLELAKHHDFIPQNVCNPFDTVAWVTLGDVHLWVGNYPYSFLVRENVSSTYDDAITGRVLYFYKFRDSKYQARPSRLTIHTLHKKLVEDLRKLNLSLK
jgi:hypothetical protein